MCASICCEKIRDGRSDIHNEDIRICMDAGGNGSAETGLGTRRGGISHLNFSDIGAEESKHVTRCEQCGKATNPECMAGTRLVRRAV